MNPFLMNDAALAEVDPITRSAELLHAAVIVRIEEAVIAANGGARPTPQEAREHGRVQYATDGTMSVIWRGAEVFRLNRRESFATPQG